MKHEQPIDRFDALVDKPIEWQSTAANYIASANFLYTVDRPDGDWSISSVGSNWPVMLLYATAAENLLKAIRIAQGEQVVVKRQLAPYFATHDLTKYATDAGVTLGSEERNLTIKLQHVLEAGKYPVARGPGEERQGLDVGQSSRRHSRVEAASEVRQCAPADGDQVYGCIRGRKAPVCRRYRSAAEQ